MKNRKHPAMNRVGLIRLKATSPKRHKNSLQPNNLPHKAAEAAEPELLGAPLSQPIENAAAIADRMFFTSKIPP